MEISKEYKDWIWAIVTFLFFIVTFAISLCPFYFGIVGGIISGFFMLIKTPKFSDKKKKILGIFVIVITPILLFFFTEWLNANGMSVFQNFAAIIVNLLFFIVIEAFICLIAKRSDVAIIIMVVLFMLLAIANGFVAEYRGYGFRISDACSVETAANMLDEYTYELTIKQTLAIIVSFFLIKLSLDNVLIFTARFKDRILSFIVMVGYILSLSCTPFLKNVSLTPSFCSNHSNGFYANILGTVWALNQDNKPENYSVSEIINYVENTANSTLEHNAETTKPVNVICIMNEALADLTIFENFNVEDPLKYIHSLDENVITGFTYASVFGGTTVISEYEFLTNNTSKFIGSTMSPYSTIVDNTTYSLAKQLNTFGYDSVFIHPYKSISYNRPAAYKNMGFNKQYYENDLADKFNIANNSDAELYRTIQKITEAQDETFIFTITIQNHSPYNLVEGLSDESINSGYGDLVDRYLTLAKKSDEAYQELIEYYSNCDEPTIILMFGDHQPSLDSNFWSSVTGETWESLLAKPEQTLYKTPFIIWANYPIQEKRNVNISINYLSLLLLEQANIPKTTYQQYLSTAMQYVPIINNNGFIDKDGNTYLSVDDLPAELYEVVHLYNCFEYNLVFDKNNIVKQLNK